MTIFKAAVLVLFGVACALVAFTVLAALFSAFHVLIELIVLGVLIYLAGHFVFRRRPESPEKRS